MVPKMASRPLGGEGICPVSIITFSGGNGITVRYPVAIAFSHFFQIKLVLKVCAAWYTKVKVNKSQNYF